MAETLGIEQEFFVVHADTAACVRAQPQQFFAAARRALGDAVSGELVGSMIEIVTGQHTSTGGAITELQAHRQTLMQIARDHSLALMACGAHPFSDWRIQQVSAGSRYEEVSGNMAGLTRRAHVCGVHVHVGFESLDARIDILNRIQPLLPLMTPITAASPMWRGEAMGVESYRTIAYSEGPRTGLPGRFAGPDQYSSVVRAWQEAGLIPDSSFCWWWVRPSLRHPTLELRIADSCADLDRIAFLVAFYRSAVVYLARHPSVLNKWESHYEGILRENLWQAARAGFDAVQVDAETGRHELLRLQLARWIDRLLPDARQLGDGLDLESGFAILERPSEALLTRKAFDKARSAGHTPHEASRMAAHATVHKLKHPRLRDASASAA